MSNHIEQQKCIIPLPYQHLNQDLLNTIPDSLNLALELGSLASGYTSSDHGSSHTAGTSKSSLGADEDVGDVLKSGRLGRLEQESGNDRRRECGTCLVFAQERKVEENLEGFGISREDDKFCDASIESFGS